MAGFRYVGADYTKDGNSSDLLTKADLDAEFTGAAVTQATTLAAISTAVSTFASQPYVQTTLEAYASSGYLTTGNAYYLSVQLNLGSVISGTYVLIFGGQTTVPLSPYSTAAAVQAALSVLTTIANVTVLGGGPYEITVNPAQQSTLTVDPTGLTGGSATLSAGPLATLIPTSMVGAPGGPAPLGETGVIPNQYIPSLGAGYCSGPWGPTATQSGSTGAVPVKIADWNIGPPGTPFVPIVFMTIMASATNGGRPVIEVRMSSGQQGYANQTLVARGVGRNNWNDLQSITVLPASATTGSAGGSGQSPTYNLWLSAWLYDANSQNVSVQTEGIVGTAAYLIRYRQ